MTRSISSRHFNPSLSHRPMCVALSRLWTIAGFGLSTQAIQGNRIVERYGSEDEKFNLGDIKSGWCYRLTPM